MNGISGLGAAVSYQPNQAGRRSADSAQQPAAGGKAQAQDDSDRFVRSASPQAYADGRGRQPIRKSPTAPSSGTARWYRF
jgi:hypothetical protein